MEAGSISLQTKAKKEVTVTLALKMAEKGQPQIHIPLVEATKVTQEIVADFCTSGTDIPVDSPLLTADEAHTTGFPMERPTEATVQVLETIYH